MSRISATVAVIAVFVLSTACNYSTSSTSAQPLSPAPVSAASGPSNAAEQLSGPAVVARVAALYPERLAGGVSHAQRVANMEFLRDRVIELGNCSGLLLAWNRKANGHRSIDAIDWRHGETDINDVVDIASAYDDTSRELQLHWIIVGGPAGWDPFPTSCR
jgi:hypothetical protein